MKNQIARFDNSRRHYRFIMCSCESHALQIALWKHKPLTGYIGIWQRGHTYMQEPASFWERVKCAYWALRGQLFDDTICFNQREQLESVRDACNEILDL